MISDALESERIGNRPTELACLVSGEAMAPPREPAQ